MTTNLVPPPEIISFSNSSLTIDTNTLFEIRNQRNDVDLYYTLDGSKPDTFNTLSTRKSTFLYARPFYISPSSATGGNVMIRAVAVTQDGINESVVVSRIFEVRLVPPDHPTMLQDLNQERRILMMKIQEQNQWNDRRNLEYSQIQNDETILPRFPSENIDPRNPTATLRCAHCFSEKNNDPYTRYCSNCGRQWEKLNFRPNTISAIQACTNCDTIIPFGSDACVVCENRPSPHRIYHSPKSMIVCLQCKTENRSTERICFVCHSLLLPTNHPINRACVSVVPNENKDLLCSICQHQNEADARFCYWCGTRRNPQPLTFSCSKCKTQNQWKSKFCLSCGCVLEKPLYIVDKQCSQEYDFIPTSTLVRESTQKPDAATQTFGIHYPNTKQLDLVTEQNRPLLRPKSPAQGYWKKQIDHVYAHLQNYAKSRPEFQSLIGEPSMGQLSNATVSETNKEITIKTVFRKAESDPKQVSFSNRLPYSYGFESEIEYPSKERRQKPIRPRTVPPRKANAHTLKLIEILSKPRRQHDNDYTIREVTKLLKQGADGNCRDDEDFTALQLAVRNGHVDCLSVLVKLGKARIDDEGGPDENTALHEACRLGDHGVEPLRILLKFGGDYLTKNKAGKTVVDLISKSKESASLMHVIQQHKERIEQEN